jgi:hypothetical protein
MYLHHWLPGVLRAAGIKVVETTGWTTRSHGPLPAVVRVVWHHDASPPGDSPGALNWMISNWNTSSAQIWVDNYGTWYLVGTGVAWHAGRVLPGMPNNFDSIGIETDQTVGEQWPAAQLNSLRIGTAAIFRHQKQNSGALHFHKTICDPPGRKQDPAGLELGAERINVGKLLTGAGGSTTPAPKPPTTTTPPKDDNDMADITQAQMDEIAKRVCARLLDGPGTTVRVVKVDSAGKETAHDMKYRDAISQAATEAARAAHRSK